ncbi:hypothetical protein ACFV1N_39540 [Streptosporangium canum]|uniref:hypothetical protein n=1 Tax=Streptosporangium canum TaxID=324952 RepID=UPI0036B8B94A
MIDAQHGPAAGDINAIGHICERATSVPITGLRAITGGVHLTMSSPDGLHQALSALHRHGYEAHLRIDGDAQITCIHVSGWSYERIDARIRHLNAALAQAEAGRLRMATLTLARTYVVPGLRQLPADADLAASLLVMVDLTRRLRECLEGTR